MKLKCVHWDWGQISSASFNCRYISLLFQLHATPIAMLRALVPSVTSRLACLTSPFPDPSNLTAVSFGHQTERRRTFCVDGSSFSRGTTSQLGFPSFLHHSSPSLTHWRGKRSFARRRELEKMGTRGRLVGGDRHWSPEEDQAIFDFAEKFGTGDGRPGPVPKMWKVSLIKPSQL